MAKQIYEQMNEEMVLAKNGDSFEQMHPMNAVAEHLFGYLCEEHYNQIKKLNEDFNFDSCERAFKLAIKHGLTHEISTGGNLDLIQSIWDKVKEDLIAAGLI